jgi:hypothetical protein
MNTSHLDALELRIVAAVVLILLLLAGGLFLVLSDNGWIAEIGI